MREVTYAKFHSGLFIPSLGTIGDTLPSSSKSFDLKMHMTSDGLFLKIRQAGKQTEVLVPSANVMLAVLAPEAPVSPVKSVSSEAAAH